MYRLLELLSCGSALGPDCVRRVGRHAIQAEVVFDMGESFVVFRVSELADIAEVLLVVTYPGEFGVYFCKPAVH